MKLVAFTTNKKGQPAAFQSVRSLGGGGTNYYFGRWVRVPIHKAREWVARGEATQVSMYPEAQTQDSN